MKLATRMSQKSRLSEYCQKNRLPFPAYKSFVTGGGAHCPQFKGLCELNGTEYVTPHEYNNKKEADDAVAAVILDELARVKPESSIRIGESEILQKYFLIIDLDNQNQFKEYMPILLNLFRNSRFLGVGSPRIVLPEICHNTDRFEFWKTPLVTKDAADFELAFRVGELCNTLEKDRKIVVFSTDFAMDTIAKILARRGFDTTFECDIVTWTKKF